MRFFTNNRTVEGMMKEIPKGRKGDTAPLPITHPCYGCSSYGGICFATCHRKIMAERRKAKNRSQGDT